MGDGQFSIRRNAIAIVVRSDRIDGWNVTPQKPEESLAGRRNSVHRIISAHSGDDFRVVRPIGQIVGLLNKVSASGHRLPFEFVGVW